jgi:hypothetical protein
MAVCVLPGTELAFSEEVKSASFRLFGCKAKTMNFRTAIGAVAGVVGIEVGVVSGVFNLESSGVDAPDWRPRHEEH